MGDVFFTSDLHLGHERIVELCGRPFANTQEMNETLIQNWNMVVRPTDSVWVLGDVALGKIRESLALVKRLNGNKLLVPGNHDRCWSGHQRIRPVDREIYQEVGFTIYPEQVWISHLILPHTRLCHMPYVGDSHPSEERYKNHRPIQKYDDEILIHGHVHNSWKIRENMINVGVDVWDFFPVHIDQVQNAIQSKN